MKVDLKSLWCQGLADKLKQKSIITTIELRGQSMGDSETEAGDWRALFVKHHCRYAEVLANALRHNTCSTIVNLSVNMIGDAGVQAAPVSCSSEPVFPTARQLQTY